MDYQLKVKQKGENQAQTSKDEHEFECEISYAQNQVSDSKHYFKNKNCQPQMFHQGDEDITLSSFLVGMNDFLCQSQKDIKTTNQSFCKAHYEQNVELSLDQDIGQSSAKKQGSSFNIPIQKKELQTTLKINENIQQENEGSQINEENSVKSNTKDSQNQNINDYEQSNIQFSKNVIVKSGTKNKISQNSSQCRSINHSRMKINSHILVQDDIFYEKDSKKLGTKVNLVLKSQYQLNQAQRNNTIYKQNLQKAANIIKMLFSSSINRVLRIRQNVQNFIRLIKLRHPNRKIEDLSEQEILSINDLSYFYSQKKHKYTAQKILKIQRFLLQFTKALPVFLPSNAIRVIWDVIQVAFTYFFLYFHSLLIFFDQNYFDSKFIQKFYLIAFYVFLSDIVITFNTAFYDQDIIIAKHKQIAKRYFFSSVFVTDFISVFLLGSKVIYSEEFMMLYLNQTTYFVFNIIIFLKANGINNSKKRFDGIITLSENQKLVIKLINQLASVMTAAHIAALGWHFVGVQESNNSQINWLEKIGIRQLSIQGQYIYSIYWAVTTMTTAQEQRDRDKQQEDKILNQLSNKLRDEITLEVNSKILNNYDLFSSNFSQSTLNKLLFIMKEILINPNEIIINENLKDDDCSIYFIQNGIIEIYQQQIYKQGQINVIQTLTKGQIFGDISFFTGMQRQASARSVNLSTLYKISRNDFINLIQENKEDFESFKIIQDQIIFKKEKSAINNICYFCKDSSHIANQCPRTHKIQDKQFVILRHNFSTFQDRHFMQRIKRKQKSNALQQFKRNLASLQRLKYNYYYSDEQQLFFYDENLQSSYETITQNSNYEDEENTQSQVLEQQNEKEMVQKKSIKVHERDKIDKSSKSIVDKSNHSHIDETDHQNNQENQIQGCHSNLIYEQQQQQDAHKITAKSFSSQAQLKSFEGSEVIEFSNQESLRNILNKQKTKQESNKEIQTKELETFQQRKTEQQYQQFINNQIEKEGSNKNNSNILDKQWINSQNQPSNYAQSGDQNKNQIRKGAHSNKQFIKQTSSQSGEDLDQNYNQENSQSQYNNKLESNKKASTSNHITSHSKINSFQKSQKIINQNYQDKRSSIDYAFQNIATLLYLQCLNVSSKQLNSANNLYQDSAVNNSFTTKRIKDQKESKSSSTSQKKNKSSSNNSNLQEHSQNKYKTEQLNKIDQQQPSQEDLQVINTLTKILRNSQLPLLLQLASAKSIQNLDSQFQQFSMESFDKMQCFKKYYPEHNIYNIIHKLKIRQQIQKKLKKVKLAQRERRQNIGFTNISLIQGNTNFTKLVPQQNYNINQYKPTNLSYGVKILNGVIYPKFNFSQQNN
ncbi:hypothetical protein ABPG73_008535 [Tetrahymena malaccensis]